MPHLVTSFQFRGCRSDTGEAFTPGSDLDKFLSATRAAAAGSLRSVMELDDVEPTDGLTVQLSITADESLVTPPSADGETVTVAYTVRALVPTRLAYGYRSEGSPAHRYVLDLISAFGGVLQSLSNNGEDLFERIGVTDQQAQLRFVVGVEVDAPWTSGRPASV